MGAYVRFRICKLRIAAFGGLRGLEVLEVSLSHESFNQSQAPGSACATLLGRSLLGRSRME